MITSLFALKLQSKRDIILARQRARQLAGLLGYERGEQILLAAAVFEIAWNAFQMRGRYAIRFQIDDDRLQVICTRPQPDAAEEWQSEPRPGGFVPPHQRERARLAALRRERLARQAAALVEPALRLEKPLPHQSGPMTPADVAWSMREMTRHTPLNLFEEIHQNNLELLRMAGELATTEAPEKKSMPRKKQHTAA